LISNHEMFDVTNATIIRKTACFFSDQLDVYIDTSDGVNDDLGIHEYCARMLRCIQISKGKRFLFFKAAHSNIWSKNLESLAESNNGKVIPFFKWSFNDDFYSYVLPNIEKLRKMSPESSIDYDIGMFADFRKKYSYPKPSKLDKRISWQDHEYFQIEGTSPSTGNYEIDSRSAILDKLKESNYTILAGSRGYQEYISASMHCSATINPPGIGEYTSRMMDQTAIGNLIILRKNSYDQGHSWKEYIPEVDFNSQNWKQDIQLILDDRNLWIEKGAYYYEKIWSPESVFNFMIQEIIREL